MKVILYLPILLLLSSCMPHAPDNLMKANQSTLQIRSAQSRSFHVVSEKVLLQASVAVLQDMGYTLKESATEYGVITATKEANAMSPGQVISIIAIAALGGKPPPIDHKQFITVTMVVLDKAAPNEALARTTFQRVVQRTDNSYYANTITDTKVYQEFYEKLDKALFLEINNL